MAKRGRPVKWTDDRLEELAETLMQYTEETEIPILALFCYENGIIREQIYELARKNANLSYAIKVIMEKKQGNLETKALNGEVDKTMAIFSLKQMGWSDKIEQTHTTIDNDGEQTGIIFK